MNDRVKKIVVRVLAVVLTALMILGVCAQFVFAAEEEEAPKTTVTISLKGLTADFPHTEVLALVSNVTTYKSQSVLFRKDKNFTADVELEDGYYLIYANRYGWKDQNNNTLVLNNNEPYNFYVGNSFDENRYPDQTFSHSKNVNVSFTKASKDIEGDLLTIVNQNTVVYWEIKDLAYPMRYIYNKEEFKEAFYKSTDALTKYKKYKELLDTNETNAQTNDKLNDIDINKVISKDNDNVEDDKKESDNNTEDAPSNDEQVEVENENAEDEELETDPLEEGATEEIEEETEEDDSFLGFIWQMILDSKIIIIILIASFVGLIIVKRKNREKILKQIEEDSYDDSKVE